MRQTTWTTAFARDKRGSLAAIFAVSIALFFAVIGASLDYGRSFATKTRALAALDAAVLAASNPLIPSGKKVAKFRSTFLNSFDASSVTVKELSFTHSTAAGGAGILKLDVPTTFANVFGINKIPLNISSKAKYDSADIEVVLVLDVSGSMRHSLDTARSRIEALKSSAKKLVDILEREKRPGQSIKVGIVPFTMNVNVGTHNTSFVTNANHALFSGTSWAGCVLERTSTDHATDTAGSWHAYIYPPEPNSSLLRCPNPSNGTNNGYRSVQEAHPIYGIYSGYTKGPNYNCVRHSILPLDDNLNSVRTMISDLTSERNQGTILAPGISWGLKVLSKGAPFIEGAVMSKDVRKFMIVLTDGSQTTEKGSKSRWCPTATNTSSRYEFDPADFGLAGAKLRKDGPRDDFSPYGYMYDSAPFGDTAKSWSAVDDRLHTLSLQACNEVKSTPPGDGRPIEIYSIAVSQYAGPGTRVWNLLENCASSKSNAVHVTSDAQMTETFERIASEILPLRLTD